jgi:hypothetical protein
MGHLRNVSSTQSNSSKIENAGDKDLMEENHLELMEWAEMSTERERLNFRKRNTEERINQKLKQANEKVQNSQNKTHSNKVIARSNFEEDKLEISLQTKGTGTTKSRVSMNQENIARDLAAKYEASNDKIIEELSDSRTTKQLRSDESFNDSNEEENPSLERKMRVKRLTKQKKKNILDKIKNEFNSNSNNRPISAAAHSVSTNVISEFVKVKKTISYLIHYNSRLNCHKNNWTNVLGEHIQMSKPGKTIF